MDALRRSAILPVGTKLNIKTIMDKETNNLMAFASFKDLKEMTHLSRARSDFYADVIYEDDELESIILKNTQVIWQHSYNNDLTIPALQPPYYSDFNFRFQNFKYEDGCLVITGAHQDDLSKKYKVTLK